MYGSAENLFIVFSDTTEQVILLMTSGKKDCVSTDEIKEHYPLDVQLLLCQLVQDAKEDSTWNEILTKFVAHPILTRLHPKSRSYIVSTLTVENIPEVFTLILKDVISNSAKPVRSRRGPRNARNVSSASLDLNLVDSSISVEDVIDLSKFIANAGSDGREILTRCCTLLHNACVSEIRQKLDSNKREFSTILQQMES